MKKRRLKSGQFSSQLVAARGQLGDSITSLIVANDGAGGFGARVSGRYLNTGQHSARFVADDAADDSGGLLGIEACKGEYQQNGNYG